MLRELIDLARLAAPAIVEMAKAGTLRPTTLWLAIEGAGTYAAAVARGDIASDADQATRATTCQGCTGHTETHATLNGQPITIGWCGERLRDSQTGPDGQGPTCGCMVTITVLGSTVAAGKAVVGSQACGRGKW